MDIKDVKTAELVKKYNFKFSKSLGQNFLVDESVPRDIVSGAEVNKDDLVLTSGLGKLYPKDIVIGKVLEVEEETGKGMKVATIVPNVEFDKLNGVLIVIPKDGVSVDGEVKY